MHFFRRAAALCAALCAPAGAGRQALLHCVRGCPTYKHSRTQIALTFYQREHFRTTSLQYYNYLKEVKPVIQIIIVCFNQSQ